MASEGELPSLDDSGFRVFSQFEEDGKLLFIFSILGMENKRFIEIGADDGVNSNSANLYFNFGWHGLFIDGNDYWIWEALEVVEAQVVIIETHNEFGMHNIVVPYDADYTFPGKHPDYHGASPVAMTRLANKKGYRLVGANELGFNFIFLKRGLAENELPEVSVESVLTHPSVKEAYKRFEDIKDWDYLEG